MILLLFTYSNINFQTNSFMAAMYLNSNFNGKLIIIFYTGQMKSEKKCKKMNKNSFSWRLKTNRHFMCNDFVEEFGMGNKMTREQFAVQK